MYRWKKKNVVFSIKTVFREENLANIFTCRLNTTLSYRTHDDRVVPRSYGRKTEISSRNRNTTYYPRRAPPPHAVGESKTALTPLSPLQQPPPLAHAHTHAFSHGFTPVSLSPGRIRLAVTRLLYFQRLTTAWRCAEGGDGGGGARVRVITISVHARK